MIPLTTPFMDEGILEAKAMRRKIGSVVFLFTAAFLFPGCNTCRDMQRFDSDFCWGTKSRLTVSAPATALCRDANDPAVKREFRRLAAAQLFATYVKPGFTSKELHAALFDTDWLDACRLFQSTASGGQRPCYVSIGQSLFMLMLFPDDTGWSPWVIWFVLPNDPLHGARTDEEGRAFLTGNHPDKRLRLTEFAIDYPLCNEGNKAGGPRVLERFTKRGVGLQISGQ
jgi:hypothetical protein